MQSGAQFINSASASGTSPLHPMNNNKKIKIGNYLLGKTIGKGNSAVVKVAVHGLTKQSVAIKIFDKNALDDEKQLRLRREIDSMKRLKHQNIIRLYEIMETNKLICLVTEYASNGELYDYIIDNKRLSERKARIIFRQILAALNHCHSHGIVHRDLKVENLLFDSNRRVKLADFGFSCNFTPGELLDIYCGSPPYCAPELYLAKLYDGPKVDIWSLGVVLYVLVCGYLPFDAHSFNVLRSQVISGSYKIPFFLSEDCTNLIKGMLNVDANRRFDISDIIKHSWLRVDEEVEGLRSENILDTAQVDETKNLKEFRSLISKIENISIEEFEPNQDVLNELIKFNLNINEVVKSVKNNEFDSNAGIYYLTEAKLFNRNVNDQNLLSLKSPNKLSLLNTNESSSCNSQLGSLDLGQKYFNFEEIDSKSLANDRYVESRRNPNEMAMENSSSFYGFNKVNLISDNQPSNQSTLKLPTITTTDTMNGDEEDEMPIEDLGRDYLSKYNSIRRHTIATNEDNNMLDQSNNIMKSTECLLDLEKDMTEALNKTDANSSLLSQHAAIASETNRNSLPNGFNLNIDLSKGLNLSLKSDENNCDYGYARKSSQNELSLNTYPASNVSGGKSKTSHSHMHPHYCKSKCNKPKFQNLNLQAQNANSATSSFSQKSYQTYQIGPYLSPPVFSGRRASDGGSNISLFNQHYSLKHSKQCNDSICDNIHVNEIGENSTIAENVENNANNKEFTAESGEDSLNEMTKLSLSKPRGSITSGIPISSLKSQLSPSSGIGSPNAAGNIFVGQSLAYQANDEEETANKFNIGTNNSGGIFNTNLILHRLTNTATRNNRNEPYMDSKISNLNNKSQVQFRTRHREQSFSGTNSSPMFQTINESFNDPAHRSSVPNQFDLINANRLHLEKIYNQSLNKSKPLVNKEPKILENENSIDQEDEEEMDSSKWNPLVNGNFLMNICPQIGDNQISCEDFKFNACLPNNSSLDTKSKLINNISSETNMNPSSDPDQSSSLPPISTNNNPYNFQHPNNNNSACYLNAEATNSNQTSNNNNNTSGVNNLPTTLQMIQEEQNEIPMLSSESSSPSSSVSTTPRMSRSSLSSNARSSFTNETIFSQNDFIDLSQNVSYRHLTNSEKPELNSNNMGVKGLNLENSQYLMQKLYENELVNVNSTRREDEDGSEKRYKKCKTKVNCQLNT